MGRSVNADRPNIYRGDILKLYFRNSNNDLRFLGEPATESEAWKLISEFLKERDWEVPYIRNWITPDETLHYDVGSHTEFFELEGYGEYNEQRQTSV